MKRILLFGAGKSATTLIRILAGYCEENNYEFIVCDRDIEAAQSKISGFKTSRAIDLNVNDDVQRREAVSEADLVISLLPPSLHIKVARECLACSKNLLTASYIDAELRSLEGAIKEKGLLFLSEMGLDPGIDHMSAMHIIDTFKKEGKSIHSFYSHCGGLIAPESDDNPWHYKITWNPMNVVTAGQAGAEYIKNGETVKVDYTDIFASGNQIIQSDEAGSFAWYANRDSVSYIDTYGLHGIDTFIRTTLRHPSYIRTWNLVVHLGLANKDDAGENRSYQTIADWFDGKKKTFTSQNPDSPLIELFNESEIQNQLTYLGLHDEAPIGESSSSADILLTLLVKNLAMKPHDKDMIVMIHEIGYETESRHEKLISTMVVKGDDELNTAMAKTVGTPLAIAAMLIMDGKLNVTGLHIPVIPEIYLPVLEALKDHGISFSEKVVEV